MAPANATYNTTFNVTATAASGLNVAITAAGVCSLERRHGCGDHPDDERHRHVHGGLQPGGRRELQRRDRKSRECHSAEGGPDDYRVESHGDFWKPGADNYAVIRGIRRWRRSYRSDDTAVVHDDLHHYDADNRPTPTTSCSGAASGNYSFVYLPGTVTVLTACSAFNGFLSPIGGAVENGTGGGLAGSGACVQFEQHNPGEV